jgi:hypothetical protein
VNAKDIRAALAVDPQAEFAVKPDRRTITVVRIRGLSHSSAGQWTYTSATDPTTGEWYRPIERRRIAGRELCHVAEAMAEMTRRKAASDRSTAEVAACERCLAMLDQLGVQARRSGVLVVVEDAASLEMVLDRINEASR